MAKLQPKFDLKNGDLYFVERLCKCKTERPCRPGCAEWKKIPLRTDLELRAFESVIAYFKKWRPEIFETSLIDDEYAFYRIVKI